MNNDFITIGGVTRDISFLTDEGVLIKNPKDILKQELLGFEYGAKIKVDNFSYSFGGGAANSAVCLANFNFKVACLASIANDESGVLIKNNLKKRGVEINLLKIEKGESSGTSFILIAPEGERIIFAQRGANSLLKLSSSDLKKITKTKNIYIASLAGNWQKNLEDIFSVINDQHRVFWNPGMSQLLSGAQKISKFIKKVTVLALNKDEALQLLYSSKIISDDYKHLDNEDDIVRAIYLLGAKIVVITLGDKGVIAYDGEKIYRRQIVKGGIKKDTTGVGDIFNSSFAAGYLKHSGDINQALDLALRNAAAKISHLGAQNGLLKK